MDPNTSMVSAQNSESQDTLEEPVMEEHQSVITSDNQSHGESETTHHSPTAIPKYYSVMEDECSGEVFTHPSCSEPEEGGTCEAAATDPSVSLRSSDSTEGNANLQCLDWPREEKQSMTSRNQVNTEMESVLSTFEDVIRSDSSSAVPSIGRDQDILEDSFKIQVSGQSTEKEVEECNDDEVPKGPMMNEEVRLLEDTDLPDNIGLKCPSQNTERLNLAFQIESEDNQNKMEVTLKQSPDSSQEEGIGSKLEDALDNELTVYDWVRRTRVEDDEDAHSSEHRELDEQDESSGSISNSRIATEILQGENLLQRLQLLQQQQDVDEICSQTSDLEDYVKSKVNVAPGTIQDIQHEAQTDQEHQTGSPLLTVTAEFEDCSIHQTEAVSVTKESDSSCFVNLKVTSEDGNDCKPLEQDLPECQSIVDGCHMADQKVDEEHICEEEKNYGINEVDEQEANRTSLLTLSPQQTDGRAEDGTNTSNKENRTPFPPGHRLSAADIDVEKQFQESSETNQDLQRAEGVLDLTENPDVLEIPFKKNISLETLPTREDPSPSQECHFSEQRMNKEISQELQRELVLVNMGKIPGGYSKGESRQMKDTKLLFEAFQQEQMEGPTRIRKPVAPMPKGQVYPSVLERTRSLEMFSQAMSPLIRTHSFRVLSITEKEKCPETFRSLSPSIRDKTRLSPYPKHEKHTHMHKSMDSLNSPSATGGLKTKQESPREGSPLLKENPFFKLRPAMSLQPEVEKDIREAKKREEELRKQRSNLYGDTRSGRKDEGKNTTDFKTDPSLKTAGRLERVWPPPSKKDPSKPEQQEAKVQRGPGNKTALWQRWESGLVNGQSPATTSNNNNNNNNNNNKD